MRYLAAQYVEHRGRGASRSSPASGRSSATATWRAWARRCMARATRCRPSARTTSRPWRTPPSPSPRQMRRRARDGLHHLDRAGRDQHGDGRGAGARQPPAGAAAARRRLSPAARPIRCCSRSRISPTARSAPTTASGPVSRYFDRITRPEQLLGRPAARHGRADRSGDLRAGDPGLLPGRAGRGRTTGPKPSSRAGSGASAARPPIRARSRRWPSACAPPRRR